MIGDKTKQHGALAAAVRMLRKKGWTAFWDPLAKADQCFFKIFPTPTHCALNDHPGRQVALYMWAWHEDVVDYEIVVCGQLADKTWVKLLQYGISSGDIEKALATIPRLLRAWESMAKPSRRNLVKELHRKQRDMRA